LIPLKLVGPRVRPLSVDREKVEIGRRCAVERIDSECDDNRSPRDHRCRVPGTSRRRETVAAHVQRRPGPFVLGELADVGWRNKEVEVGDGGVVETESTVHED
jgi:hypothetical protein